MESCKKQRFFSDRSMAALFVSVLGVGACGSSEVGDDAKDDVLDVSAEKADGAARPIGTFASRGEFGVPFSRLVLMTDRTFFRAMNVPCPGAPFDERCTLGRKSGKVRYSKAGKTTYLRFFDKDGKPIDRYAVHYDGTSLSLRVIGAPSSHAVVFNLSDRYLCQTKRDCKLQGNRSTIECVGDWVCQPNDICRFSCSLDDVTTDCSTERPIRTLCGAACSSGYKIRDGSPTCDCCDGSTPPVNPCIKTGCSGQICADQELDSTCQWWPEYACYNNAACERQPNGRCDWTEAPTLRACLASHQQ